MCQIGTGEVTLEEAGVRYLLVGTADEPGAHFEGTPEQFEDGFFTSASTANVVAWATWQQLQAPFLPAAP